MILLVRKHIYRINVQFGLLCSNWNVLENCDLFYLISKLTKLNCFFIQFQLQIRNGKVNEWLNQQMMSKQRPKMMIRFSRESSPWLDLKRKFSTFVQIFEFISKATFNLDVSITAWRIERILRINKIFGHTAIIIQLSLVYQWTTHLD